MKNLELQILSKLIHNEEYLRKVTAEFQPEYLTKREYQIIFKTIKTHFEDYNSLPTKEVLYAEIENYTDKDHNEDTYKNIIGVIKELKDFEVEFDWLIDKTEDFMKKRAMMNAVINGYDIIEGKNKNHKIEALPDMFTEALAVGFDKSIGHNYIQDYEKRYDFYTAPENKTEFDIDYLNKITNGGVSNKTLNLIMAETGLGKTMLMCHFAANNLAQGKNVLYITMEMAEERIAERIDANLMNIDIEAFSKIEKKLYFNKFSELKNKISGNLIIKEYPTVNAHAGHFKNLIEEIQTKKKIDIDIVYIDYLNICLSKRFTGGNHNSYTLVKAIAEEVRGLAGEYNIPIFSATQTNREGIGNLETTMKDMSDSIGTGFTVDLLLAMVADEEMLEQDKVLIKQLKNRYGNKLKYSSFFVGVDRPKMRFMDFDSTHDFIPKEDLTTKFVKDETFEEKNLLNTIDFDIKTGGIEVQKND